MWVFKNRSDTHSRLDVFFLIDRKALIQSFNGEKMNSGRSDSINVASV